MWTMTGRAGGLDGDPSGVLTCEATPSPGCRLLPTRARCWPLRATNGCGGPMAPSGVLTALAMPAAAVDLGPALARAGAGDRNTNGRGRDGEPSGVLTADAMP